MQPEKKGPGADEQCQRSSILAKLGARQPMEVTALFDLHVGYLRIPKFCKSSSLSKWRGIKPAAL